MKLFLIVTLLWLALTAALRWISALNGAWATPTNKTVYVADTVIITLMAFWAFVMLYQL